MEKANTVDASEITAKLSYSTPELLDLGEVTGMTQASNEFTNNVDGASP